MFKSKQEKMLIVDDIEVNRAILAELFSNEYDIIEAENGKQALNILTSNIAGEIAIMLLDIVMPEMDGFEVLTKLSKLNMISQVPIIVITSEESAESESKLLDMGAADIIRKPFIVNVVKRRVKNVTSAHNYMNSLEKLTAELSARLRSSNVALVDTLTSVIEHRSAESGKHIVRIRKFTEILLKQVSASFPQYNLDDETIDTMASASTLHDIGKIVIPDSILNKPGKLTAEEFEIMKSHSAEGSKIVMKFSGIHEKGYLDFAYRIAKYHHERFDGKGYPDGLAGAEIPVCAQVTAIADVYDALTTPRVYKEAYSHQKAVHMILDGECGAFSEEMKYCLRAVAPQFEQLAEAYADAVAGTGTMLEDSGNLLKSNYDFVSREENAKIDHYKYLTVLKFLDAIVAEHDYDRNSYEIVYPRNQIYEEYGESGDLEVSSSEFINKYVHPEDRMRMTQNMYLHQLNIVEGNAVDDAAIYRIINPQNGKFEPYQVFCLNVYTQNIQQHKAIVIFKRIENIEESGDEATYFNRFVFRTFMRSGQAGDGFIGLINNFGDMMFAIDLEAGTVHYGKNFDTEVMKKVPVAIEDFISGDVMQVHEEDRQDYVAFFAGLKTAGEDFLRIRFRCADKQGDFVHMEKRVMIFRDEAGKALYAVGMDINQGITD